MGGSHQQTALERLSLLRDFMCLILRMQFKIGDSEEEGKNG